jgi:hypothetical protein
MTDRRKKSAAEVLAELEKDPVFVERQRQLLHKRQQDEEADKNAEARLVQELREAGVPVLSVWDLVNTRNSYLQSLPILLNHLAYPYPETIYEGIARAMAVPEAKFAWPALVAMFAKTTMKNFKDGLAVAIANVADRETIGELVELARNPIHGESRVLLLSALERMNSPDSINTLIELGRDPVLHKEVQRIVHQPRKRGF